MKDDSRPTRRQFRKWRSAVRGKKNPERMDNPFWIWCVRNPVSAYAANEEFGGPDSFGSDPCWCFDRMGQAHVELPDGRHVYISGEHEDHYDPDFFIYNDVVVIDGEQVQIFGYLGSVFPPTDFHSATLVGSDIFLIGNLGYPDDRMPDHTQVMRLEVGIWRISTVQTSGELPGWIHKHNAEYLENENAIVVTGGLVTGERILENFDDYKLCLESLTWTRLTDRHWGRWILEREDGEMNNLWEIRSAAWDREMGRSAKKMIEDELSDLGFDLEDSPEITDEQIDQLKTLYHCPFTNQPATEREDEYSRYWLDVEGTPVRIDEESYNITVTVEGQLPEEAVKIILSNLRNKLSKIEGAPYRVVEI